MNQDNDIKRLGELIRGTRVAMITTADEEGSLHSRPMTTQDREFDGTLWFITAADSVKVHELSRDRKVNISFANHEDSKYVSVSGTASVEQDREKIKEFWSPFYKALFPEGVNDPNIALLRVVVEKAEYWDSPSSSVARMLGFAKAIVTGKRYAAKDGDHEKIEL